MSSEKSPHIWSSDSLANKCQRYAENMLKEDRESWLFAFWSSLVLELLLRSALSKISPVFLADEKKWENLYFALQHEQRGGKPPKSLAITTVLDRVESLYDSFTREMKNFSIVHIERRNSELHSGDLPFDKLGTSTWLPQFYHTCKTLLKIIDRDLDDIFGQEESQTAEKLISANNDKKAKEVMRTIILKKQEWSEKTEQERSQLAEQAKTLANRGEGHRVICPACGSSALLTGSKIGSPNITISDVEVIEKQSMLPTSFKCTACLMMITGFSKLHACGLGDSYTQTLRTDTFEYFGYEEDHPSMYFDEDNNERY